MKVYWILASILMALSLVYSNTIKATLDKGAEISLREAINLGLRKARKWNEDAYLISATSVDETMGGTRGTEGKRYKWTLCFESSSSDQQLFVGISKGEISGTQEGRGPSFGKVNLGDIKFDSPYLLEIAKEQYNLQKGVDWATGYHFTLDNESGNPTVTVLGNDPDGLFARVSFDARNGEISDALHKVPKGGGIIKADLDTGEFKVLKKAMAINGITTEGNQWAVWGDEKPRQFNLSVQPFSVFSKDGGRNWSSINVAKEKVLTKWILDNELYVATESGLWHMNTFENKIKKDMPIKIEEVAYSTNNNIAVLSNNHFYKYISKHGKWITVGKPKYDELLALKISEGGAVGLLTNNGEVLIENDDEWISLELPQGLETPSYMELIGDHLFLLSDYTLWVQNLKYGKWDKIQTDYEFNKLINKGNNLFGVYGNEVIYLIKPRDDEWEVKVLLEVGHGIITDIELSKNHLLIATLPDYHWAKMN
ncbi:hypothetical protein ACFFIY_13685 [Bhargavaea ullalensis]|uniref:BNR repeat-containing family member n=1 Tax=Bhargavaea ullalensis TaxID=1265685 RepID=A0ABV2G8Z7_9BACL